MPTYEYRCPQGHESEDFVLKMSDAKTELPCPICGAVALRRMSAGSGLLFKGSGFYITDYGKDGKKDQRAATAKGDASATTPDAKPKSDKADAGSAAAAAKTAPAPAASSTPKSGPAK